MLVSLAISARFNHRLWSRSASQIIKIGQCFAALKTPEMRAFIRPRFSEQLTQFRRVIVYRNECRSHF